MITTHVAASSFVTPYPSTTPIISSQPDVCHDCVSGSSVSLAGRGRGKSFLVCFQCLHSRRCGGCFWSSWLFGLLRVAPLHLTGASEVCSIASSLFFKKNLAVNQVLWAGAWKAQPTFATLCLQACEYIFPWICDDC